MLVSLGLKRGGKSAVNTDPLFGMNFTYDMIAAKVNAPCPAAMSSRSQSGQETAL